MVNSVCQELLTAAYGGTNEELVARVVDEVNSAQPLTAVSGWSALLPFAVKQVWDRLDLDSKMVAYVTAIDQESDDS